MAGILSINKAAPSFGWAIPLGRCSFNTVPPRQAYLNNRSSKGFTVIQAVIAWSPGGSGAEVRTPTANINGDKPWFNDNPATPNDTYFKQIDRWLNTRASRARPGGAANLGLLRQRCSLDDCRKRGCVRPVVRPALPRCVQSGLGRRGDRVATGYEEAWRELARGLREGDGGAHLITYHPCGWRSSSQYFHNDDWLDFNMIETWTEWAKIHPAITADFLRLPASQ